MKLLSAKRIALVGIITLGGVVFFMPTGAQASWTDGILTIAEFFTGNATGFIAGFLKALLLIVGGIVAWLAKGLGFALVYATTTHEYTFIRDIWILARNFVNMLFILAMITMAYASILKLWPNYTIQKMLPQVLAVAILMNFSFAITITGVEIFDSISTTLLANMQDAMDRIAPALSIKTFLSFDPYSNTASIPKSFFSILMYGFVGVSFFIAFVFVLIKIPILWALLISSPVALFSYLIPSLKKKVWDRWLSEYIRWNTFLPIFLLCLYVGLYVLAQQDAIIKVQQPYGNGAGILGFPLSVVFFYLLVGFIFLGGTAAAISGGIVAGSGAVWGATKAKQMTYDALGITGAQRAWQAKVKEIEKSGLKGQVGTSWVGKGSDATLGRLYKGEKANEEWQKWWTNAKRFGASESQFAKNIGDEKKSLQDKDASIEALRDILRKKNYEDPETFAAAQILLDKGKLSLDGMRDVYQKYAEISPRAAKAFGDKIAEKVNRQVEDGEITGAPNLNKALELMAQISGADKTTLAPLAAGETEQEREKRIVAFEQKTEIARDRIKELLKKAKKKDPNWATERQILRQTYEEKDERGVPQIKDYITVKNVLGEKLREVPGGLTPEQELEQGLEAAIAGLNNNTIRELPSSALDPKPENRVFIEQLVKMLSQEGHRIEKIMDDATPEQLRKLELWLDVAQTYALTSSIQDLGSEFQDLQQELNAEEQRLSTNQGNNAPQAQQVARDAQRKINSLNKKLSAKEDALKKASADLRAVHEKLSLQENRDKLNAAGIIV